jgi:hypothetical protein
MHDGIILFIGQARTKLGALYIVDSRCILTTKGQRPLARDMKDRISILSTHAAIYR